MTSSARCAGLRKLAGTDEKNLSTSQSPTKTNARVSRPDGDAGGAQCAQAAAQQGTQAAGNCDSAQAAGLTRKPTPNSFGEADRLHRRDEYLRVQRQGTRYQTAHFVLYASVTAADGRARLGIAVSRRIGKAVVRNRLKRRVRECFRTILWQTFAGGTDVVVIARAGAGELSTPTIRSELMTATLGVCKRLRPQTQ